MIVKLFHGEALALSYEVQLALIHEEKPVDVVTTYTKPWSACSLLLDGQVSSEAQTEATYQPFDIIDTSNLGDMWASLTSSLPQVHSYVARRLRYSTRRAS